MKKTLKILGLLIVMGITLSSCKSEIETISSSDISSEETSSVEEVIPEPVIAAQNPLNGEIIDEALTTRAVSVMLNNSKNAWPQNGISGADVIYELPVEGGYTRLMALFTDYTKVEKLGSIRSARHDFVELAKAFNCIFVHWGGSPFAYEAIPNLNVENIDGMTYGNTYFYTDTGLSGSRGGIEHCRFLFTEKLTEAITNIGLETTYETPMAYNFNQEEESVKYTDTVATKITVPISSYYGTTVFTYDATTNKYLKEEADVQTVDGNTGEPITIDNVFVLYTSISMISDIHKDLDLNSGTGYYITNGTKTAVNWSKGEASDLLTFTTETGEELVVNRGNSWVLFSGDDLRDTTTFE